MSAYAETETDELAPIINPDAILTFNANKNEARNVIVNLPTFFCSLRDPPPQAGCIAHFPGNAMWIGVYQKDEWLINCKRLQ